MKRRNFIRNFAATAALLELTPDISYAFSSNLRKLHTDLEKSGDNALAWKRIEYEFFLQKDLIYLNTGSLGPTPGSIVESVNGYALELEKDPVQNMWGGDLSKQMEQVRNLVAEFTGADKEEIILTRNTTEAMNMVAASLDLRPGDEILTTNHEHGGGMVCWQYLARQKGIKVKFIELPVTIKNKAQLLQLIQDKVTPRTKVCSLMHVDTITGMKMPLTEIARILRPKNILFITDGAQAPGMLDVNLHEYDVDVYCASSHKWMLGPKGTGFLYIRKEAQDIIKPISSYSGNGVYSASSGTRSLPQILGQGLAINFHQTIGKKKIEERCKELSSTLRDLLIRINRLKLLTPPDMELQSGMVTFSIEGISSNDVFGKLLEEHQIRVKHAQGTYAFVDDQTVVPKDYNALRFSTHIFNNEEQIEKTAQVLQKMLS